MLEALKMKAELSRSLAGFKRQEQDKSWLFDFWFFGSGVESMPYDVEAIRKRLKQSMGGKFNDPDQFRPDNAKSATEPLKYRFFILPPLMKR